MSGKYGVVALKAVEFLRIGKAELPQDAWRMAVKEVFPEGQPSQNKGRPRSSFIGLCEDGLVVGVPACGYLKPGNVNISYAFCGVEFLIRNPSIRDGMDADALWKAILEKIWPEDINKQHDQQMDVVLALWDKNLIAKYVPS